MTDAVPADLPLVFDALTEEGLRAAGSLKWTRYGDAIGAFVAEMDFGTAPVVTRALHAAVDAGRVRLPADRRSRRRWPGRAPAGRPAATAGRCPAEWITPLPDVLAGLQAAIEHFTRPAPRWCCPRLPTCRSCRSPAARPGDHRGADGARRTTAARPTTSTAWTAPSRRAGELFVHCNPHNPLGRVFTETEQLDAGRGGRAARRPGVLRRDPRAAGPPRRRPPALRLASRSRPPTRSRRPRPPRRGTSPG